MDKLVITKLRKRTAAVLFTDGHAVQIDFEPEAAEEETGVIFVGKVKNISKNINAAFVEYRPGINGFYSLKENQMPLFADGKADHGPLKSGDEILVQVERSAVKTKDAVLTSNLTLSGETAVFTAGKTSLGISAKIRDKAWKDMVRQRWEETPHEDGGLVIRTNGFTTGADAVFEEFAALCGQFRAIRKAAESRTCGSVLYRPADFAVRTVRNLRQSGEMEIITDLPEIYEELSGIVCGMPGNPVLRFYEDEFPLTALYHLETILSQALAKTVWLKSGGNLVIEPTEALTVIDVNTAKSSSKKDSEETYLKTNLEAADAIAVQLRLRNLSGIILVDFIDMKEEESRKKLLSALKRAVSADPVKTVLVDMTPLGLVELTRKKVLRPLHEQINPDAKYVKKSGKSD